MKSFNLWVCSAAIVAAVGLAGNAWCQDATSESSTTVTTVPAEPTVTSKTVTHETHANPPVVVANPGSSTSTETTTTDSSAPSSTDSMHEKTRSDTTYGPMGTTHTEKQEKSTTD